MMHILGACERTKEVLELLVPPNLLEEFYSSSDCFSWVDLNLRKRRHNGNQNELTSRNISFSKQFGPFGRGETLLFLSTL